MILNPIATIKWQHRHRSTSGLTALLVRMSVGLIVASVHVAAGAQNHHHGDATIAIESSKVNIIRNDASKVTQNYDGLRGSGSEFKNKMIDAVDSKAKDKGKIDPSDTLRMDKSTGVDDNDIELNDPPHGSTICGIGSTKSITVSVEDNILSLAEVQVFATVNGVETNVALKSLGAVASQSSTQPSDTHDFGPDKAIDGSTDGAIEGITHTESEVNSWWRVDLPESYDISRIVLWNRMDCCSERLASASVVLSDADSNPQATFRVVGAPQGKGPSFHFLLPLDCTPLEGTYYTRDFLGGLGSGRPWWAFKPSSCPPEGCPLFFWIDGTGESSFQEARQQYWMTEMYNRGFVAATVDYADNILNYGSCFGHVNGNVGIDDKAKDMFDRDDPESVINQLCNRDYVNCEGVAVGGFSQGAQIVQMGGDFDDRISAALLYGCGNDPVQLFGHQYCMDTLKIPKQRRRYFSGDNDPLFFQPRDDPDFDGYSVGRRQLTEESHYLCPHSEAPDDCIQHEPATADDPYTGGIIANTGGYYIIPRGFHGQFMEWSNFTVGTSAPFNRNTHLDWLASTSQDTKAHIAQDQTPVALTMDLNQFGRFGEAAPQGIYFEWASSVNNLGVLGRRFVVARDTTQELFFFEEVPTEVIGFRLQARTVDAALVDSLQVGSVFPPSTFKNLSFERNGGKAFCFSVVPDNNWGSTCLGEKSHLCIDFCTDGSWHDCTTTINDDFDGTVTQVPAEFSACPIPYDQTQQETVTAYN